MNEPDRIEEALKKLQPGAMPPRLMARLTVARAQVASRKVEARWRGALLRWFLPIAASACVAIGTFFWLERNRESSGQVVSDGAVEHRPVPVESEDFLVTARPVGILVAPNQRPYRIMEVEWLEHETVRTDAGGPALHTATTRRDVIPVALELY